MKLTDYAPRFSRVHGEEALCYLGFRCPCRAECTMEIVVPFTPALDRSETPELRKPWKRESGDTFETLTLSPSILFYPSEHAGCAGWHGFLRNGNLETC